MRAQIPGVVIMLYYIHVCDGDGEKKEKRQKRKREDVKTTTIKDDFDLEPTGKYAAIEIDGKGEPIAGMIIDARTFWFKF